MAGNPGAEVPVITEKLHEFKFGMYKPFDEKILLVYNTINLRPSHGQGRDKYQCRECNQGTYTSSTLEIVQ